MTEPTAAERDAEETAFLEALATGELDPETFGHSEHLRAGYLLLRRHGFGEATTRMSAGLRRVASRNDVPEKYHETVTLAFMALINERIVLNGDGGGWPGFLAANPDLLDGSLLSRYYRPETLRSERARRVFMLEPLADQAPAAKDLARPDSA